MCKFNEKCIGNLRSFYFRLVIVFLFRNMFKVEKLGNNVICNVGVGAVGVRMFYDIVRILIGFRYVFNVKRIFNLFVIFDLSGYLYIIEEGVTKIINGFLVEMEGKRFWVLIESVGLYVIILRF